MSVLPFSFLFSLWVAVWLVSVVFAYHAALEKNATKKDLRIHIVSVIGITILAHSPMASNVPRTTLGASSVLISVASRAASLGDAQLELVICVSDKIAQLVDAVHDALLLLVVWQVEALAPFGHVDGAGGVVTMMMASTLSIERRVGAVVAADAGEPAGAFASTSAVSAEAQVPFVLVMAVVERHGGCEEDGNDGLCELHACVGWWRYEWVVVGYLLFVDLCRCGC